MNAIIFDTETTSAQEPEIIEAAWIGAGDDMEQYYERFLPSKPISLGAMATHHIVPSDLAGCRPSSEFKLPAVEFLIGHNIDFDWKAAGSPPYFKRICTLALSRWLYPEIDSHSQSAMMYHLFPHPVARQNCLNAHNALADVRMCKMVLQELIKELKLRGVAVENWHDIYEASEMARIPTVMSFGKHKGMAIKDIPDDYKRWLMKQDDVDPYLVIALRG